MNSKRIRGCKSLIRITLLGLTSLGITACSSIVSQSHQPIEKTNVYSPFSYKQQQLEQLVQWDVEGKIAAYVDNKNNSGLMTWRQRGDEFDLLINGPLGSGQLRIEGQPDLVIATSNKNQVASNTVENLFEQEFGWPFPMHELRYWVRGIPKPNDVAKISLNSQGNARVIEQAGWHVTFHSYNNIAVPTSIQENTLTSLTMPKKIEIIGNDVRLILVLKSWSNLSPFPRPNLGDG
ncbi:MAG: outer membrane lipoprotein LolB [Oceanospirillaceae bacterium]|nr:outer membrane lipoprotein LolB [Oceanospirillaceae bacterium]